MNKTITLLGVAALLSMTGMAQKTGNEIHIDFAKKGAEVPAGMFGIFFEEINHSGEGGLYAELVQNRAFEDTSVPEGYTVRDGQLFGPQLNNHLTGTFTGGAGYRWPSTEIPAWSLEQTVGSGAAMSLCKEYPLHPATPTSLAIRLPQAGSRVTLTNSGFWGMNIVKGEKYSLRFYVRKETKYKGDVKVRLVGEKGEVLAERKIDLKPSGDWTEYRDTLEAFATDPKGVLKLDFEGEGTVWLDYVSLFPVHTFGNRPNGLRKDVAEMLVGLNPGFVRWPGGCIVEGITRSNRVKWKETLGDPMTRPGNYNTWGYRASMGLGYHEFLQFCEDIGAAGMFVCNAGLGCQYRHGDACTEEEVQYYVDDLMDALEYALGDGNTEWGKKRIENGHIEPFPLKYVEVGNENWGKVYEKRYDIFYKAIKAKYPQLTVISTLGLGGEKYHEKADMVDPHWYVAPEFFFQNTRIFDQVERTGCGVYVGEYACNAEVGSGNMLAALSEAAFISGMERNADLVKMASYAPLLENVNDRVWPVNLIRVDPSRVMGRSSYYVQRMYALNRPSYNLATELRFPAKQVRVEGKIGVGTYNTQAEYKDIVVTRADGSRVEVDCQNWKPVSGDWSVKDGAYVQSADGPMQWSAWQGADFGDCTIELKARKLGGKEGFLIFYGMNEDNGYVLNLGGWNNAGSALERMREGNASAIAATLPLTIETGRWYDIRLVVKEGQFSYYCDGKLIQETPLTTTRQYAISGFDEKTNEIIVKVVNAEKTPFRTKSELGNVQVRPQGKVITLSADSPEDENTLDDPKKIYPVEKPYNRFSSSFEYQFAPWSFTIMRIKVDKAYQHASNPVFPGWYADPEGAVFGDEYWIFPTLSDYYAAPGEPTPEYPTKKTKAFHQQYNIQTYMDAFSSKDLINWKKHPRILSVDNISWLEYALWAPSVVHANGKYYFFFGANDIQNDGEYGGIGVAVANKPEGPYRDVLGKPLIDKIVNGAQPIDQFVFRDDDGTHYMYYGGWGHCNMVKLSPDLLSIVPFEDGSMFKEVTPENYVEGPFMLKRNGKYYFMWSEGGWMGPDYSVAYAISDSPFGPFKRVGKILQQDPKIATGAGHHSVIQVPGKDEWYIIYHRRPLGDTSPYHRETCIDRMYFDEKGLIKPVKMTINR